MTEQVVVSPSVRGIFAAIAWMGVRCRPPPKGIRMVLPPTVESKRSHRPRLEQTLRSETTDRSPSAKPERTGVMQSLGIGTNALACRAAPLLWMKEHGRSTMRSPRQRRTSRSSSETFAMTVALTPSAAARATARSTSASATTAAMRSWDSLIAISVPSSPAYFRGTESRSTSSPSASSPTATETPPAPKSLQRLTRREKSGLRNRRWSFRSSGALPFCTSAPQSSSDRAVWARDEPVAPPHPSRPVRPPSSSTRSPGSGRSRRTWSSGTAATTAPTSMRLAT